MVWEPRSSSSQRRFMSRTLMMVAASSHEVKRSESSDPEFVTERVPADLHTRTLITSCYCATGEIRNDVLFYVELYANKGKPHRAASGRPPCDWCGVVRRGPSARRCRICQACRAAHYCSPECQREAWSGGHWAACGPATKMRSERWEPASDRVCNIVEDVA